MNENMLNPLGPDRLEPRTAASRASSAQPSADAATHKSSGEVDVSFEVLLARLHVHARVLDEKSQELSNPEHLSGAVEAAKASLDDAVTLGDRLLEAYREARQLNDMTSTEQEDLS